MIKTVYVPVKASEVKEADGIYFCYHLAMKGLLTVSKGNLKRVTFSNGANISEGFRYMDKEPIKVLVPLEAVILTKEDAEKIKELIELQIKRCTAHDTRLINTISEDLNEALQILNK